MDNRLSKFEKVRILGQRAEQISMGAPPLVDITGLTDALSIAEKEFLEQKRAKRQDPLQQAIAAQIVQQNLNKNMPPKQGQK